MDPESNAGESFGRRVFSSSDMNGITSVSEVTGVKMKEFDLLVWNFQANRGMDRYSLGTQVKQFM